MKYNIVKYIILIVILFNVSLGCNSNADEKLASQKFNKYTSLDLVSHLSWDSLPADANDIVMVLYDSLMKSRYLIQKDDNVTDTTFYKEYYNPVTIAQYALKLYDEYIKTNSEYLLKDFLKQASFFIDERNYHVISHDEIAYPYYLFFEELYPIWYSGMAQGQIISVLLRYYDVTKDKSVLDLVVKTKNFMLKPLNEGGCLDFTNNGCYWIEEYPDSPISPNVLNGFMFSYVGLYEYCKYFPEDKYAKYILDESLKSLKQEMDLFQLGSWLLYDLNEHDKQACSSWYMKLQYFQFLHLYEITKDDFFKKVQYKTAYDIGNKTTIEEGSLIDDILFCDEIHEKNNDAIVMNNYKNDNILTKDVILYYKSSPSLVEHELDKVFDNNTASYFHCEKFDIEPNNPHYFILTFKDELTFDTMDIYYPSNDFYSYIDRIFVLKKSKNSWEEIGFYKYDYEKFNIRYRFNKMVTCKSLSFVCYNARVQNGLVISEVELKNIVHRKKDNVFKRKLFSSYQTSIKYIPKDFKININIIDKKNMQQLSNKIKAEDVLIIYKYDNNPKMLTSKNYMYDESYFYNTNNIIEKKADFYQFLIIIKNTDLDIYIDGFDII